MVGCLPATLLAFENLHRANEEFVGDWRLVCSRIS